MRSGPPCLLAAFALVSMLLWLAAAPMLANEPIDREITPLSSDSEALGTTQEGPLGLRINEYTGKVQLGLPALGPKELSLVPAYKALNRELHPSGSPPPDADAAGSLGFGWHLGMGYVSTRKARWAGNCQLEPESAALVDGGGNVISFFRDGLVMNNQHPPIPVCSNGYPNIEPFRDRHFIDDQFRRLTRDQAEFGQGRYYLLSPAGGRSVYEPSAHYERGQTARYYPTTITRPDGRSIEVFYRLPLSDASEPPQIDRIVDVWGRELKFVYTERGAEGCPARPESEVRRCLTGVGLHAGGKLVSTLGSFEYAVYPLDSGQRLAGDHDPEGVVLLAFEASDGRRTEFKYEVPPDEHMPFVSEITLPSGGRAKLSYGTEPFLVRLKAINCFGCASPPNCTSGTLYRLATRNQTRVSDLQYLRYDGTMESHYEFVYQQHDPKIDPEPFLLVTVAEVTEGRYRRTTKYGGQNLEWCSPTENIGTDVGQLLVRDEEYDSGIEGASMTKQETWSHLHRPYGWTARDARVFTSRVETYEITKDGGTEVVEFERTKFMKPSHIARRPAGASDLVHEQTFAIVDRFTPIQFYDDAQDHDYQPNLVTLAEERLLLPGGAAQKLGRIETRYVNDLPLAQMKTVWAREAGSYGPGGGTYPATGNEGIRARWTYHPSGGDPSARKLENLEHFMILGGSEVTEKREYEYGVPSLVDMPEGPDLERSVLPTGLVDWQKQDGVLTDYKYDSYDRLELEQGPVDYPVSYFYSPVDEFPQWKKSSRNGTRWTIDFVDSFGRPWRTESLIEAGVTSVSEKGYNEVGLSVYARSPRGSEAFTDFDVQGRPVRSRMVDSDGNVIAFKAFEYSFDDTTGESKTVEISSVSGTPGEPQVKKVTTTDLVGRTVRAETNPDLEGGGGTTIEYTNAAHGLHKVTTKPDGGLERVQIVDWLGRTVEEDHPETGVVRYAYDRSGDLYAQEGPGDDYYTFERDSLGRLIEKKAQVGAETKTILKNTYDPMNNQLVSAESYTDDGVVRFETTGFDDHNRPETMTLHVPDPLAAPGDLSPSGQIPGYETFPLWWQATSNTEIYKVQLHREGADNVLRFDVAGDNYLQLDEDLLNTAIGNLPEADRPAYNVIIDPAADSLLNPEFEYFWRVRGITRSHEPTVWSPWQRMRAGCQITSFGVIDGYNSTPTIDWATDRCEGMSVHVLVSTDDLADEGCELDGALFSGLHNGPRPAHFMVHGYNYSDASAANSLTTPFGYNIVVNGHKQCDPLSQAHFRMEVVDVAGGGAVLDSTEPETARAVIDPDGCQILGFYLNHGYGGQPPVVSWSTQNCSAYEVSVLATSVPGTVPGHCVYRDALWEDEPSGTRSARLMVDGWLNSVGETCGPVDAMDFELEATPRDPSSNLPPLRRLPIRGLIDPPDDGRCRIQQFDVSYPGPGQLPVVSWDTANCTGQEIDLRLSTLIGGYEPGCRLRERVVAPDIAPSGSMPATFMASGYEVDGNLCGVITAAEVWVTAGNQQSFVVPITYDGAALEPPCRLTSFSVENQSLYSTPPIISWSSTCAGQEHRVEVVTSTIGPQPPGCELDDDLWDALPNGQRQADYMAGWDHCPAVGEALFEARIVDAKTDPVRVLYNSSTYRGYYDVNSARVDLTAESLLSAPVELWAGDTFDVQYLVRNLESSPADSGYRNRFYLAPNTWLVGTEPILGTDPSGHGSLLGDSRFTATTRTLAVPADTAARTYYLLAELDFEDVVSETRERNNLVPIATIEVLDEVCEDPPQFLGIQGVAMAASTCGVELTWPDAYSSCGHDLEYRVYRGSHSSVQPTDYYRIASGVAATSYIDIEVATGAEYFYTVTAYDPLNRTEVGSGGHLGPGGYLRITMGGCSGASTGPMYGGSFSVSPTSSAAEPLEPGTPITVSWEFPDAESMFLVGFGIQPLVGSVVVYPTTTSTFEAHPDFGSGLASYQATVFVEGSVPPERMGLCDQPCWAQADIDGMRHYCRGVENEDHTNAGLPSVDVEPRWMTIPDWVNWVGAVGEPFSPYCFVATCGAQSVPPFRFKTPEDTPDNWISPEYLEATRHEIAGDGWDNDCDGEIDETD